MPQPKRYMIDPPDGHKYGFPKVWPHEHFSGIEQWLVENGYPQEEIDDLGDWFYFSAWEIH